MSCFRRFQFFVFSISFLFGSPGVFSQESILIPERDWTSSDGKTIRAALIGFEEGQGRFRTPEGRRFLIPDDRFSLRDQVPVFVARLETQLELSHSKDINTDFYYSKHIPRNRRNDKIYTYLGFGPDRFNLGIFLNHPSLDFFQFEEVAVLGPKDKELAIYPLRDSDMGAFTVNGERRTRVRLSIHAGRNEEIAEAVEEALAANQLRFVARGKGVEEIFPVDESEANGLRETLALFRQAAHLINEGFLKRERIAEQSFSSTESAPASPATGKDPLEPFRNSLSQKKYGTLDWNGQTVDGVGYLETQVVIRTKEGNLRKVPFTEISPEGRKRLVDARIEDAFGDSQYRYDSGTTVYYHPGWDENRLLYSQAILLVLHSDGNTYLRANAWTSRLEGKPVERILVRGDQQETPFPIACNPNESRERKRQSGTYTTVSAYLDSRERESAFDLLASTSIEFRIQSGGQNVSVSLKEDELHITREAIALFQWIGQQ